MDSGMSDCPMSMVYSDESYHSQAISINLSFRPILLKNSVFMLGVIISAS